ncbi:GDCCVxC domain-containing (seleno)protein [Flavobacterium aestivum]|uniref:GDCCVxC domain-containing (seleno)protein n=1 Tax=Flavobacterium aestivum TaxID=3003257 RepID=UPI003D78D51F
MCSNCGEKKKKQSTDACQFFYEYENCKIILKPQQRHCCVYCSYGSIKVRLFNKISVVEKTGIFLD